MTQGEQPERIDLTEDDDNDVSTARHVRAVISTIPNFIPAEGSYSFSVVNVSSLSSPVATTVPSFLYDKCVADTRIGETGCDESLCEAEYTHAHDSDEHDETWEGPDDIQSTDVSNYWQGDVDNRGNETDDETRFMRPSIPINPLQHVQFNREFYGRSRSRIILKRHICPMCGKRLLKKSDLERHIRVHTGEKPFSCPVCGKRFSQKHNVDLHRRRKRH